MTSQKTPTCPGRQQASREATYTFLLAGVVNNARLDDLLARRPEAYLRPVNRSVALLGRRETSNAARTVADGGGSRRPAGGRSGNVGQSACPALVSTSLHDLPYAEHL